MTALRFALVGDPVAHSRSPAMHAAAFRALGLPHTYEAIRATAGDVARLVAELRAGVFAGLNVTVPHKRLARSLADDIDASAARSGACNVLARRAGRVVAFDTDTRALAAELRVLLDVRPAPRERALVLGAGGAARSAVAALVELGFASVAVRARRPTQAAQISAREAHATVEPWAARPELEAGTTAIVQATSAGMSGAEPGDAASEIVAWGALPVHAIALDVVYAPPETPFLRAARARGLACANGLGMLARQGALALELWLGLEEAPLAAMRAAVV